MEIKMVLGLSVGYWYGSWSCKVWAATFQFFWSQEQLFSAQTV